MFATSTDHCSAGLCISSPPSRESQAHVPVGISPIEFDFQAATWNLAWEAMGERNGTGGTMSLDNGDGNYLNPGNTYGASALEASLEDCL